jgi:hypothetical protein
LMRVQATVAMTIDRITELQAEVETLRHLPLPSQTFRDGDPSTSVAAGRRHATNDVRRFNVKSRACRLLRAYENAGMRGLTAYEAASQVAPSLTVSVVEGTRRRVSDLVRAGFLVDSQLRRKNLGSATESTVWRISTSGVAALGRLRETGWSK